MDERHLAEVQRRSPVASSSMGTGPASHRARALDSCLPSPSRGPPFVPDGKVPSGQAMLGLGSAPWAIQNSLMARWMRTYQTMLPMIGRRNQRPHSVVISGSRPSSR